MDSVFNNSVNFNMLGILRGMQFSIDFLYLYKMAYHDNILILNTTGCT